MMTVAVEVVVAVLSLLLVTRIVWKLVLRCKLRDIDGLGAIGRQDEENVIISWSRGSG